MVSNFCELLMTKSADREDGESFVDTTAGRGRIFCLMGKSASGKDTIYQKLLERGREYGRTAGGEGKPLLGSVIPYTTRPIRTGEENGVAYFFEENRQFEEARAAGAIIEFRDYNTVCGIWHYYTKDDGQIHLEESSYLLIGTLESYRAFCGYYGSERVVPLYLDLDPGERLERALRRERKQRQPQYAELCRRFLADEQDFSDEKLCEAGITVRYRNDDMGRCVDEIWKRICQELDLTQ